MILRVQLMIHTIELMLSITRLVRTYSPFPRGYVTKDNIMMITLPQNWVLNSFVQNRIAWFESDR